MSYQDTVLTNWTSPFWTILVWVASNNDPKWIPTMSEETNGSSVYPNDSVAASFIAAFTSSTVTFLFKIDTNSVNEPVGTGTLWAAPSNFPFNSGTTNPIAFAAPVELGTIFTAAALALLKSPYERQPLWTYLC